MAKPELLPVAQLRELYIQQYDTALPTAFDESLTILEKINKMILRMHELGELTNEVAIKWNELIEWIVNDGLTDLVTGTLESWYTEGRFADLVIQIIDELKEQGVSITSYGAKPDGSDSIVAIEQALASGYPVFIPNGTFYVSRGIKLPSNTILNGAGIGNAVIKFMNNANIAENLMYNENIDGGNVNIFLEGFTLDGNVRGRFGDVANGVGGTRGSGLTFRRVRNGSINRIHSTDNVLHGIDVTCAGIDYPYLGDGTTAPNPSEHITINECETDRFGDDGITTHHSQYISISNCYSHDPRTTNNSNGIEIDDGSRHVILNSNRSKGCYGGVEVKAHANASAPYNVIINGHLSIEDVRSYNFRHIGHHSENDPISLTARNIIASNLSAVNPNNNRGFQGDITPRALAVSGYNGVSVNGLSAYTNQPNLLTDSVVTVQFNARNVSLSNFVLNGFKNTENGIYIIGGGRKSDNVNITNVTLNNSGRNGIYVGGGITNANITNVNAIGTEVNGAKYVVQTTNSNPQISGISGEDYPNLMRIAGIDYTNGLTLFNGGFRGASSSSGNISETGAILASTSASEASGSKSFVGASSSSKATGERSVVFASSNSTASGVYASIIGSLNSSATNENNFVLGSSSSIASGNRSSVLSSYGVKSSGSYKVNGGFGEPDSNGQGLSANIKWELDSLNGKIKASDSITGSSSWSDYAEYFESVDGEVFETGTLVALLGDKIKKAEEGDAILGVVSETAGVVLGEQTHHWQGRYLKNEFGGNLYETKTIVDVYTDDQGNETETTFDVRVPVENPEYDPESKYTSREDRDEWHIIGMVGQVYVRCDQTISMGDSIKAINGIATKGDQFKVMKITTPYDATKGYGVAKVLIK